MAPERPGTSRPGRTVPLHALRPGQWGRIQALSGGRGLVSRAMAMGLTPGTPVCLLSSLGGPVIISVRGLRLAVGRQMAWRIQVDPGEAASPEPEGTRRV
ncbi:MAG: FeoA domain-containing protein [Bacillota bacterium]